MKKNNSYQVWINAGYTLFAEEGHEGLHTERLARITGLNKSGFYHYFGDTQEFLEQLLKEHDRLIDALLEPMFQAKNYDPEYLDIIIQNKNVAFFQIQLVRNRHIKMFVDCHDRTNKKTIPIVSPLFCKEIGVSPEAAVPYFEMMRDMYYTRVDYKSFTYEFLHSLVVHCKNVFANLKDPKTEE